MNRRAGELRKQQIIKESLDQFTRQIEHPLKNMEERSPP